MKKIVFILALVYSYQLTLAQTPEGGTNTTQPATVIPGIGPAKGKGRISGRVLDASTNEPVPFATAALTDPATNKPIDGAVGDDNGKFTILKVGTGTYKIVISFIGYQDRVIENVTIGEKKAEIDLGTIKINPAVQELNEVTVEAQKTLIEEKVDRTIYNAENDITNRGGDATDVLRKVPMLSVDLDGNVSLRGSQNLRVLINNKPSTIAASSVADALKQIPSDMIKSVEVITSPSSKYDAEGSTGIINIITKKNTLEGFSLNVDGGVGLRGSNLGLNGNYRKGKMGFSLGGFGRANYNMRGSFTNNQQTVDPNGNQITNIQTANTRNNNMFGRYQLGWDYDIDKNNFISSSVQFGVRNGRNYQDNLLTQSYENEILNELRTRLQDVETKDLSNNVDVNVNYTHLFAKPQQEFSILTQYSRNNRNNDFFRNTLDFNDLSILNRTNNLNDSYNQETTIQLDYQTPISKNQMLEVGGKGIMRQVSSDYVYLFAQGADGEFLPSQDGQLANVFNYNQNITAGYFSYTLTTKNSYSLKAGARYEYTTIDANFQNEQEVKIPSYGTLVPSINLSKKLKNGNTIKAAYNRRIQRPSLQFLNPNIQSSNPLYVTIGNPDLRPEFTDNYELSYNTYIKKTSLSFSAFMRNTTGAIQSIRDINQTINEITGDTLNTIRTTYQNIGNEDTYGMSIFANVNLSNKLSLNGGTDVYYAILDNNVPDPLYNASNEGWVYNIRGFGSYKLERGWALQLFGFYRGRQVQLQGLQGGFGIYSLGLRKDFNNKKGSIGLGVENFFGTSIKIRNELKSPVLTQTSVNEMQNLSFRINFSYRIGKLKMDDNSSRRRRRSVANDDLKDGGGSNVQEGGQPQGGQGEGPRQGPTQGQGQKPGQAPANNSNKGSK